MSSLVKNLHPEHLRKTSVIIGNGYCLCLMTLFSWRELLIQHTLLSSFESLFMWINIKSFIKHLLFSYSTQSKSAFDGHLDEWVLSLSYICPFILGIQNLCRKAFESIFIKDLIVDLDVKHVFLDVEFVWIQISRWTKRDGLIKPFHVSFWAVGLESSLG